jgi:hypothetical protein
VRTPHCACRSCCASCTVTKAGSPSAGLEQHDALVGGERGVDVIKVAEVALYSSKTWSDCRADTMATCSCAMRRCSGARWHARHLDQLHLGGLVAGQPLHAGEALVERVVEVVNYGDPVAILQQRQNRVAACVVECASNDGAQCEERTLCQAAFQQDKRQGRQRRAYL